MQRASRGSCDGGECLTGDERGARKEEGTEVGTMEVGVGRSQLVKQERSGLVMVYEYLTSAKNWQRHVGVAEKKSHMA